jgi:hypothetical protein
VNFHSHPPFYENNLFKVNSTELAFALYL